MRLLRLTADLIYHIANFLTPSYVHINTTPVRGSGVLNMSMVCKPWRSVVLRLLWKHISTSHPVSRSALTSLSSTLHDQYFSVYVQSLHLSVNYEEQMQSGPLSNQIPYLLGLRGLRVVALHEVAFDGRMHDALVYMLNVSDSCVRELRLVHCNFAHCHLDCISADIAEKSIFPRLQVLMIEAPLGEDDRDPHTISSLTSLSSSSSLLELYLCEYTVVPVLSRLRMRGWGAKLRRLEMPLHSNGEELLYQFVTIPSNIKSLSLTRYLYRPSNPFSRIRSSILEELSCSYDALSRLPELPGLRKLRLTESRRIDRYMRTATNGMSDPPLAIGYMVDRCLFRSITSIELHMLIWNESLTSDLLDGLDSLTEVSIFFTLGMNFMVVSQFVNLIRIYFLLLLSGTERYHSLGTGPSPRMSYSLLYSSDRARNLVRYWSRSCVLR